MAESATPNTTNKKGLITGIIAAVAVIVAIIVCVLVFSKPSVVGKYNLSAFIEDGKEYYCSDECLHLNYSEEEYENLHN